MIPVLWRNEKMPPNLFVKHKKLMEIKVRYDTEKENARHNTDRSWRIVEVNG